MPIYLRNFYYNELVDTRKKENDEVKKANQRNKSTISRPAINPRFKRYHDESTNPLRHHNDGDMHIDGLSMPLVCSSSLKKKDFEDSLRHMYGRKNSNQYWHYESLLSLIHI